ncbi:PREDICTED: calcium-binding tyrosine phosphorylation-regulated protein [Eurypyga helias]|uniref:calcium-binding tyrosine phosphorylation-regulated protein n=1 Tax=Eurypyga helias TaxID=54383 RepID=UPI0005285EB0|nr:PREDICTED: calcium-binding tyrosine phosphorylation-regulated protein [Eurypyga helias]
MQILYEDSQTSENKLTPAEGAAEDASADPAAEMCVGACRSQPGPWSQSSVAGEPGPSESQAEVSTDDVSQASLVTLWEEPPPSPLSPPPVALCWDDEPVMEGEVPPYVEQFPQKIIIPFIDRTAYLVKIEQPLTAGGGGRSGLKRYNLRATC